MKMEELSKETLKGFAADYEKDQEPIKDFFFLHAIGYAVATKTMSRFT